MLRFVLLFLLAVGSLLAGEEAIARTPFVNLPLVSGFRIQRGDDPRWADPSFDDRAWPKAGRYGIPSRDGIYWVRFRVRLDELHTLRRQDTFVLSIVASYEVYWDGRLLGANGRPGMTAEAEERGVIDRAFRIPEELSGPGEHLVALRLSSFHTGFPSESYGIMSRLFALPDYVAFRARSIAFSLVAFGAACVVGLIFGLLWLLADRRPTSALFSVMCFIAATQQGLQALRGLVDYPYSWHFARLISIALIAGVLGLLLVVFLIRFFQLRRLGWRVVAVLALYAAAWPSSPIYNVKAISMTWCALAVAIVVTIEALVRRRRGAPYVLAGLVLSIWGTAFSPREFLEHSFVFTLGAAMLGCIAAFALQWREDRRLAQQTQLTAARLEIELLKKNIQPHFILNTLATVMEVIEQDPKTAVTLVESLAREFRIVSRVSGERLIPLAQELELCRAHLEVMSLRKAAACTLTVDGAHPRALVPPAMFLTLIENGLTHLLPVQGRLEFVLRAGYPGNTASYTLLARGQRHGESPAEPAEGTGLRYIRARLTESFLDQWTLTSEPTDEGWLTTITVYKASYAPETDLTVGTSSTKREASVP